MVFGTENGSVKSSLMSGLQGRKGLFRSKRFIPVSKVILDIVQLRFKIQLIFALSSIIGGWLIREW